MRSSPYLVFTLWLMACVASAQEIPFRKPPFLHCIPLYIDRPVKPTVNTGSSHQIITTIGYPGDPYYFVRSDTRSTNLWKTADHIEYHQSSILIIDETITMIGSPGDPFYEVRTSTATYAKKRESILFPNRTSVHSESSSHVTDGVITENTYTAIRYCYGTRIGTPITKAQFERLKRWLGIE